MKKLLQTLPVLLLCTAAEAQKNYKVDSSFGVRGYALSVPSSSTDYSSIETNALQLLSDGKIWEAGRIARSDSKWGFTFIQKRNSDGTLDASFAGDGFTATHTVGTNSSVVGIFTLKDGVTYASSSGYGGCVIRGTDTNFYPQEYNGFIGGRGWSAFCAAKLNDSMVVSGSGETTNTLLFHKDNGIGSSYNNYANSGYLDPVYFYFDDQNYYCNHKAISVLADGKYLTAGGLYLPSGWAAKDLPYSRYAFIARYKSGNSFAPDSTFGTNGLAKIDRLAGTDGTPYVSAMVVEASGSILVCVVGTDSTTGDELAHQGMRFNANGTFRENVSLPAKAIKLILNSDGVIFSLASDGTIYANNPDGSVYTRFFGGSKSINTAEFGTPIDRLSGRDFAMNANGDIISVGYYYPTSDDGYRSYTVKYAAYTPSARVDHIGDIATIEVYPNPTKGMFHIESSQEVKLSVYNLLGQKVYHNNLKVGHNQIDLSSFASGLYTIKLSIDGEVKVIKLEKQ